MQSIFEPFDSLIMKYSFGPCAARLCIFSDDLRAVCIRPYNYFLINFRKAIIILLPQSKSSHNAFMVKYKDNKFTVKQTYSWTVSECWTRMKNHPMKTFILFRDNTVQPTYLQIVNALIANGLFQV